MSGNLVESAEAGDQLAAVRDLRDLLARQIVGCDSLRDLAALSRQFTDVLAQIEAIAPSKAEVDAVDEITARRAARGAGSAARPARAIKPKA